MAEPARIPDVIDTAPAFTLADVARLTAKYAGVDTQRMLADLLSGELKGRVAAVSSFGAESAVLLDMVAKVDRDVPVIFLDTGKLFPETLEYRDALTKRLGLTDVRSVQPDPARLAAKDSHKVLWMTNPDLCCHIRKTEPLQRALQAPDAGCPRRNRFQSSTTPPHPTARASSRCLPSAASPATTRPSRPPRVPRAARRGLYPATASPTLRPS